MKMGVLPRKVIIRGMGYFYLIAGINHFLTPGFYLPLIPPFFTKPEVVNYLAGISEVMLGMGILYYPVRKRAAWGIVLMLVAFIPSHWYFIQMGSCIGDQLCVDPWVGWVRLVLIHPMLIFWAIWVALNPKIYG